MTQHIMRMQVYPRVSSGPSLAHCEHKGAAEWPIVPICVQRVPVEQLGSRISALLRPAQQEQPQAVDSEPAHRLVAGLGLFEERARPRQRGTP